MIRTVASMAAVFALAVASAGLAQDKKDDQKPTKERLIGTWKLVKTSKGDLPPELVGTIEFAKDGKLTIRVEFMGQTRETKGTWMLDGTKLKTTRTQGDKEKSDTKEIKKLTADELVIVDEKEVTEEFKRVKKEKKE